MSMKSESSRSKMNSVYCSLAHPVPLSQQRLCAFTKYVCPMDCCKLEMWYYSIIFSYAPFSLALSLCLCLSILSPAALSTCNYMLK